ncbi:MAG: glycine/sarcosine/betaine reductase complex component C subunit alpha [Clostridia bacterium]
MNEKLIFSTIKETFEELATGLESGTFGKKTRVGLTVLGSEHGIDELIKAGELAAKNYKDIEVVLIGAKSESKTCKVIEATDEKAAHSVMDKMLLDGSLDAAVTMHYNFPIGVATVGKVITPATGSEMYVATTTGTSATDRVIAMIKNAIYAIATAKAGGIKNPTIGILNIEGARQVERALNKLKTAGYEINFVESARSDGGVFMRGNDLLMGVPDVMVTDSLTGNVLMKLFSAYSTGGNYESLGYGYGPGCGEKYDRIINIISRASGAPVIAGAIRFAADSAQGNLLKAVNSEFKMARAAGLAEIFSAIEASTVTIQTEIIKAPPEKPVTADIPGIEIMQLEDAVQLLWKNGIFAASGMGCTGPIVMIAPEDKEIARNILKQAEYI